MFWVVLYFLIFSIFPVLILVIYIGWERLPEFKFIEPLSQVFTTIIIPFRNEEENLSNLLNDLQKQKFNTGQFEIIAVNDHSEDQSLRIVNQFSLTLPNLKIIDLPENEIGKKKAIKTAVDQSSGELIITIDADCQMNGLWLQTIIGFYLVHKPSMIICPLLFHQEKSFFQYMQSLEIMSLVASGAGACFFNRPILCNGANLAFTKEVYLKVHENIDQTSPSGDDVFLMSAIKKKFPKSIRFLKSADAVAFTKAEKGFSDFFNQRKRWASKAKYYKDFDIIATSWIVFTGNLILLALLIMGFWESRFFLIFIFLFIIKSFVDLALLQSFARFFKKQYLLKYFLGAQLIYPIYIVFTAIFGTFGKIRWKQRIYR